MHRFYLSQSISGDSVTVSDREILLQMNKVLRLKAGNQCIIFDGSGREYICDILTLSSEIAELYVVETRSCTAELKRDITLYAALLKGDYFEWVLQKATELGVRKIVPLVTERAIVRDLSETKRVRYSNIIKEATEQCGGCVLPVLEHVTTLEQALDEAGKGGYFCYEGVGARKQEAGIRNQKMGKAVAIFVGPEGGFSDGEVKLAKKAGANIVSLGSRILRAETASIAACAIAALS